MADPFRDMLMHDAKRRDEYILGIIFPQYREGLHRNTVNPIAHAHRIHDHKGLTWPDGTARILVSDLEPGQKAVLLKYHDLTHYDAEGRIIVELTVAEHEAYGERARVRDIAKHGRMVLPTHKKFTTSEGSVVSSTIKLTPLQEASKGRNRNQMCGCVVSLSSKWHKVKDHTVEYDLQADEVAAAIAAKSDVLVADEVFEF